MMVVVQMYSNIANRFSKITLILAMVAVLFLKDNDAKDSF